MLDVDRVKRGRSPGIRDGQLEGKRLFPSGAPDFSGDAADGVLRLTVVDWFHGVNRMARKKSV